MISRLTLTFLLSTVPAAAYATPVTYAFSGIGTNPGGDNFQQSFTYFSPDPVTVRTPLYASQLAFDVNAQVVVFDPDFPPHAYYNEASDAILVQVGGNAFGYYFPVGTFSKLGTFAAATTTSSNGHVTITAGDAPGSEVPEPASSAVLATGFAAIVSTMLARRQRSTRSPSCRANRP